MLVTAEYAFPFRIPGYPVSYPGSFLTIRGRAFLCKFQCPSDIWPEARQPEAVTAESPLPVYPHNTAHLSVCCYAPEVMVTNGEGGPARSTLFYNLYLYQNAFRFFNMGYASALAWVLFLIVLLVTLLVFRSSPFWVYYEGEVRK